MKKIAIFFILICCFACSSDDNSEVVDNDPAELTRLVASEFIDEDRNVRYQYDSMNRLTIWDETFPDLESNLIFQYNEEGNINRWDFQDDAGFINFMDYTYDSQNRLISYQNEEAENVQINYQGNQVFLSGRMETIENSSVILELNADGKVIKMTENDQFTVFSYDAKGNMITAQLFRIDGSLQTTFTMEYDSAPNPFFGQLNSIYIERFIDWFWRFNGVDFGGYEGYRYTYNSNNLVKVSQDGEDGITHTRVYDEDNFPITITRDFYGNVFEYTLEYIFQ